MHVVVIPSWYPQTENDVNGIFFRIQAQALQRQGLQVGVVAPLFRSLRGQPDTIFSGIYGLQSVKQSQLESCFYHSMYFFPRFPLIDIDRLRWVRAGLKAFEHYRQQHGLPDILHAHCVNYGGILAHALSKKYGIPYVITEHSSTYARHLIRAHQWPAMHQAVRNSSARFAVSRDFCQLLEQSYHVPWDYLPNMLNAEFSEDFIPPQPAADFTFCSVSRLHPLKGHDILLQAFAQVVQRYPHVKLKIGGDGSEAAKLKHLAEQLKLTASVSFLGRLNPSQVTDLMRHSHAFVLASHTETFGVVFIEALSQGLPLIATRCGGPQSIVNAENGYLVPSGDVNALSQAMIQMYENHHRFSPVSIRQHCLAEFGEDAVTGRLITTFKQILATSS